MYFVLFVLGVNRERFGILFKFFAVIWKKITPFISVVFVIHARELKEAS